MTVRRVLARVARLALVPALALAAAAALASAAASAAPVADALAAPAAPARPIAPPVAPAPPAADAAPRASLLVTVAGPSVWQQFAARLADADGSPASAVDVRARAAALHGELAAARAAVLAAQAPAVAAAEATGARVVSRYATLANGFLLHATADQVARLATVPGVLAIEPAPLVTPQLDASVPFIGGPALQALKGYDGTGSFTAVIDTGVDYTHAQLGGPGTTAAWAAASAVSMTQRIDDLWEGKPLFPSAKVVAGYDFVGRRYNPPHLCSAAQEAAGQCTSTPIPDDDPIDGGGHGSHVSGIVAGNAFAGGLSNGVAPGAKLVGLKLYGEGGGDEAADLLVDAIEWCGNVNLGLETRGVVPPRVDAVNISLGENWAVASMLFDTTAAAATAAGVTIVASAGNANNRPFIVGTPSTSPSIVSVAATVPPESGMEIVTTYGVTTTVHVGLESSIARPFKDAVANIEGGRLEGQLAWFGRGCADDPQLQDVTERVALVERGLCNLSDKILKAQSKGAIAVLMFTNENPKSVMAGDGAGITIPAAMIDRAPGEALRDVLLRGVEMRVAFDPSKVAFDLTSADQISGYSSRGPSLLGALKPDIAAPGSSILSARMGSGTGGASWDGTSMAGPHVAGAAGVIAQRSRAENLELDGLGVAALLMNYAQPTVYGGGGIVPIARQGAGRVDVLRAGTGPLLVRAGAIASLNLGIRALTAPVTVTLPLTVTNLTDAPVRFTFGARYRRPTREARALTFRLPGDAVTLAAHAAQRFDVPMPIEPALLAPWTLHPAATGDGVGSIEAIEIDGWLNVQPVDANAAPLPDATAPAAGVPFYLLARRAAAVESDGLAALDRASAAAVRFTNTSPFTGTVELFHRPVRRTVGVPDPTRPGTPDEIVAMPTDPDEPTVPAALDVAAVGVRATTMTTQSTAADRLDFAVVTHEAVTIPIPQQTQIYVDTDRDGVADWRIRAGNHAGPDRVQTLVAAWDAPRAAITGTERMTDTLFSSDVATHANVLSVPMTLLGMKEPAPFDFWVVRRGTHEDWAHVGVPDVVPDGADAPGGPRLTFDPAAQAREATHAAATVAGEGKATIAVAVDAAAGKRDDGFLAVYAQNDFAPSVDDGGGQWAWLVPGQVRVQPIYLPAVFSLFDAGVGPTP